MTRVDIPGYLASCHALAVRELKRVVPTESALGGPLCNLMLARPAGLAAGLRAALCLATCRALGGMDKHALPAAAVLELYHCASEPTGQELLDQAGIALTMPRSTGHTQPASDAANAVLALSFEPLLEQCRALGAEKALRVLQVVGRMARETAEGRAIEASWIRNGMWGLTDADYRGMVLKKWGWRGFVAPTKIGAIAAGANGEQVASLEQFAADLGFAFQLYDDVRDLSRSSPQLGRGGRASVRERKHTLPLLFALRASPPEQRARMMQALQMRDTMDQDLEFVDDQVRRLGGGEYAQHIGEGYALRARTALDRARTWLPGSEHGCLLYALADFTIARVF